MCSVCICVYQLGNRYLKKPEDAVGSNGSHVIGSCQLSRGCQEPKLGAL